MTKQEKQLFLIDLSARLPYGVKCNAILKQIDGSLKSIFGTFKGYNGWVNIGNNLVDINTVKPYLRPMSSMTEEEKKEYAKLLFADLGGVYEDYYKAIDYLLKNHFDYRGLIEKKLAISTEEFNPYEK